MARYVDLDKVTVWHCPRNIAQMREWAFGLPMEDVAPVVHVHWIRVNHDDAYKCSNCGSVFYYETNYCGFCGAKMDEEANT